MITTQDKVTEEILLTEMYDIAKRLNLTEVEEALYFPKYLQIETSRVCNARCPFCAIDQWDKSTPVMKDSLFEKIVSELKEYSHWIEFVAIQRAGEPLLDKKIAKRVQALKEIGIKKVSLSTNASLLTEKKAQELLEAGLDELMLSIDAVEKKRYEMMRVGLNFEAVVRNIQSFFTLRDKIRPKLIVRVRGVSFHELNNSQHRKELQDWEDFWETLRKPQDRIYMKRAHNWGNQKNWDDHTPQYDEVFHPCIIPWSTMHVTAMGKVPLCPMDFDAKLDLGDINVQSMSEVWRNEKWSKIREAHRSGQRKKVEFCQGCRLFDLENSLENWQQKQLYEN